MFLLGSGRAIRLLLLTDFDGASNHLLFLFERFLLLGFQLLGLFESALHHFFLFGALEAVRHAEHLAQLFSLLLLLLFRQVGCSLVIASCSFSLLGRRGGGSRLCRCRGCGGRRFAVGPLLLQPLVHLHRLPIQLLIALHHQALKR